MEELDDLVRSIAPTERTILEAVDEYSLYCFYTGIDDLKLNRVYPAPYRIDPLPSFVVFTTNRYNDVEYLWKDHGKGEVGSIFNLIQKICGLRSKLEVFAKISDDFGLGYDLCPPGGGKIVLYGHPREVDIKIRVATQPPTEAGLAYWKTFGIGQDLLERFCVNQIKWYWSYNGQQTPYLVPDPTFSYRMGQYYQVYSPFAPKIDKFRNDLPENYFFGYLQLPPTGKKLIVDKSCKDVIFCKRLGYDAVTGKSETTFIPERKMLELRDRFEEIYLMLDNDTAGKKMTERYLSLYPWLKPRFLTIAKDKTDACRLVGIEETGHIVKALVE